MNRPDDDFDPHSKCPICTATPKVEVLSGSGSICPRCGFLLFVTDVGTCAVVPATDSQVKAARDDASVGKTSTEAAPPTIIVTDRDGPHSAAGALGGYQEENL